MFLLKKDFESTGELATMRKENGSPTTTPIKQPVLSITFHIKWSFATFHRHNNYGTTLGGQHSTFFPSLSSSSSVCREYNTDSRSTIHLRPASEISRRKRDENRMCEMPGDGIGNKVKHGENRWMALSVCLRRRSLQKISFSRPWGAVS